MPDVGAHTLALTAVFVVTGLLPIRIDRREDHFALLMVAGAAGGVLGGGAILLLWPAVVVATPLVFGVARLRTGRFGPGLRSVGWLLVTSTAVTGGLGAAAVFRPLVLGGGFPVPLDSAGALVGGSLTIAVGWAASVAVRCGALVLLGIPFMPLSPRAFDSVLVPYLLPTVCGFPLVTASVALYDAGDPWASVVVLAWVVPVHAASAYELHRRQIAHELRRDALAAQRLAAIGELSARVVHQSRHQVGLMGWSIHRLRAELAGSAVAAAAGSAASRELDALAEAKDRLTRMLAADLLLESRDDVPDGVRLCALVEDVVDQLSDGAQARGIVLRTELAAGTTTTVPGRLRDAVFNLVDNAVDAARTSVRIVADDTAITVVDDGQGLAADHRDRAFEPFFTTKPDGTGMGLPIAEALVTDLGGAVRYDRADGTTTFTIELPAGAGAPAG